MASHHQINELDSGTVDSVASNNNHDEGATTAPPPRVRFMCSFGGKILPRPHDNQLRYVGGDTRIVAVHRHTTFSSLLSKLSKLSGTTSISVKYQLPNEDLDSLITVAADEDVENMMEEYDRISQSKKSGRLRVFLFPTEITTSRAASSINSLLDGSTKRGNWFVDALNGGPGSVPVLERGRSEVSSIVSEVPDYLFGLAENSEEGTKIMKSKNPRNDDVSVSDPGSPAPVLSSPFCSTSSSLAPPIPDLPPVKTKLVNPVQLLEPKEIEMVSENMMVPQQTGYPGGLTWHYQNPAVQHVPAVYYMPAGSHVQPGNVPVQTVPFRAQFVQPYQAAPGQVTVGFTGAGQVYGSGVRPYEMPAGIYADNANQGMYYGGRNMAVVPGSYPGMVVSGGEEMQGSGNDMVPGRAPQ